MSEDNGLGREAQPVFHFRGIKSDTVLILIVAAVYLGMFLGELPQLKIDRTGIALLGAIALIVNGAFQETGLTEQAMRLLAARGVAIEQPAWLLLVMLVLSNAVSNVPAVMLLLPLATDPLAGPTLALSSTLAGNLLVVGYPFTPEAGRTGQ